MSKYIKNYFIGDPDKPHKRGQDKYGTVYCILWLIIYAKGEFFAKPNEYTLGSGGGSIGKAKSIDDARKQLHKKAVDYLTSKKQEALDKIGRIDKALKKLGDDPANLEQFVGEYDSKRGN